MSHPDFILDKRVVERNIAKGLLTYDDVEKYKSKLPDVEDNAEICTPDAPEDEENAEEGAEAGDGAEAAGEG